MAYQEELATAVEAVYVKAEEVFQRKFRRPFIRYDLKGSTAGQALYSQWQLRFNVPLYKENTSQFIARTVPHEVAHLLVKELYTLHRVKPHGYEWRSVCRKIGMEEVTRCHNYDVKGHVNRHKRPYKYVCGCREFSLTITKHRRIRQGANYFCKSCKGTLQFVEIEESIAAEEAK